MPREDTQFGSDRANKRNDGGLTAAEREARDAVRKALATPPLLGKGLSAYERLLDADNPLIVKDFMDRVGGKPKERVEVTGEEGAPLAALLPEDMVAFAKWRVEQRAKTESLPDAPTAK